MLIKLFIFCFVSWLAIIIWASQANDRSMPFIRFLHGTVLLVGFTSLLGWVFV